MDSHDFNQLFKTISTIKPKLNEIRIEIIIALSMSLKIPFLFKQFSLSVLMITTDVFVYHSDSFLFP